MTCNAYMIFLLDYWYEKEHKLHKTRNQTFKFYHKKLKLIIKSQKMEIENTHVTDFKIS